MPFAADVRSSQRAGTPSAAPFAQVLVVRETRDVLGVRIPRAKGLTSVDASCHATEDVAGAECDHFILVVILQIARYDPSIDTRAETASGGSPLGSQVTAAADLQVMRRFDLPVWHPLGLQKRLGCCRTQDQVETIQLSRYSVGFDHCDLGACPRRLVRMKSFWAAAPSISSLLTERHARTAAVVRVGVASSASVRFHDLCVEVGSGPVQGFRAPKGRAGGLASDHLAAVLA